MEAPFFGLSVRSLTEGGAERNHRQQVSLCKGKRGNQKSTGRNKEYLTKCNSIILNF